MLTLSATKGIGGIVKSSPEDFIVKEITLKGKALNLNEIYTPQALEEEENKEGKFTTFVLQKRDWETVNALIKISKLTGHGKKSIGYAGTKDRQSISVQLASIFGVEPEKLLSLKIKDISINGAWKSNGIEMGANLGNAFEVRIKDCSNPDAIDETLKELDGKAPNYFDRQRFGMRLNNVSVGMKIIKGDFDGAVTDFLTNTKFEINEDTKQARNKLREDQDFKEALQYFPKHLKNERSVIEYLSRYDNKANALRKLPRGVLLMFIHSVQSLIFNAALEYRIKEKDFKSAIYCDKNFYGFPDIEKASRDGTFALGNILGYETKQENISDHEKDTLEKMDLKTEDFKIKSIPELSMKGSARPLLMPIKDVKYRTEDKDITIAFSIPSGSYATIFLNEITKSESLNLADINFQS